MAKQKKQKTPITLDLHGRRVHEVFDLVDQFISKNQNRDRLAITPGKGAGKVKAELIRYLKMGGYPWEYETLPNGNKNGGNIIVIMD